MVSESLVSKTLFLNKFVREVFPAVDKELNQWRNKAKNIPDPELAKQALASIRDKRFHALGGSVFAITPQGFDQDLVQLIVALQTISDYLDNLCDRAGCEDQQAFRTLHESIMCAVDVDRTLPEFYQYYPFQNDGGYLRDLTEKCRQILNKLPAYSTVKKDLVYFAGLYSDLQVYKHGEVSSRESLLVSWFEKRRQTLPEMYWWEFSAATGSTLSMFSLFAAASRHETTPEEVMKLAQGYFPWICGLHILLDYFIDQEEDRREGDLNFCFYYNNEIHCQERLLLFLENSLSAAANMPQMVMHQMVVKGLLALYLSDPKVQDQCLKKTALTLVRTAGWDAHIMYRICVFLRKAGLI